MSYLTSHYSSDNGIKLAGLRVFNTQEEALAHMAFEVFEEYKESLLLSDRKWRLDNMQHFYYTKLYEVGSTFEPKRVKPEVWRPLVLAEAEVLLKEYEKTL